MRMHMYQPICLWVYVRMTMHLSVCVCVERELYGVPSTHPLGRQRSDSVFVFSAPFLIRGDEAIVV